MQKSAMEDKSSVSRFGLMRLFRRADDHGAAVAQLRQQIEICVLILNVMKAGVCIMDEVPRQLR